MVVPIVNEIIAEFSNIVRNINAFPRKVLIGY